MNDTLKELAERANRIADEMEAAVKDIKSGVAVEVDNTSARDKAIARLAEIEADVKAHPERRTWKAGVGYVDGDQ